MQRNGKTNLPERWVCPDGTIVDKFTDCDWGIKWYGGSRQPFQRQGSFINRPYRTSRGRAQLSAQRGAASSDTYLPVRGARYTCRQTPYGQECTRD